MQRTLFSIVVFLSITHLCFAQMEIPPDSIASPKTEVESKTSPLAPSIDHMDMITPDVTPLPDDPVVTDKPTLKVEVPAFQDTPYPTQKLGDTNIFKADYSRSDAFSLTPGSAIYIYSYSETYPTIGTLTHIGANYLYQPDNRWTLTGGTYAAKYTMPSMTHGARSDFGFNTSIGYRINSFLAIRAVGQYSVYGERNSEQGYLTPLAPQSYYGAIMNIKVTERLQFEAGMERVFDPMRGKWRNMPVFYPIIDVSKKKKR